jgi:3-oxoacyl-[acyl-carrier-protein] synthase II
MRRVVVTGFGILSPVGSGKKHFFDALAAGRSAIRRLADSSTDDVCSKLGAELTFDPLAHLSRRKIAELDRTTQISLVAVREALSDAGLVLTGPDGDRCGTYWGTGMGSTHTIESSYGGMFSDPQYRIRPATIVMSMNNSAAAQIAIDFGIRGPGLTYSTACSSSAVAIGEAFRAIRYGVVDRAVAGGAEAMLTPGTMRGWQALRILAQEDPLDVAASCRPFSRDRTGFVLGEGAAAVVLEELDIARRRGAVIHAEVVGYGSTTDACHITKPDVRGQAEAMRAALSESGLRREDIGYISAHGTATSVGDVVETEAIKAVFGSAAHTIPISSTKSMHGHLIGAAGATEFAAAVLAMIHRIAPPTAHLRVADPECDLDYVPNEARHPVPMRAVMSNSFAFGGNNAVLVAKAISDSV